MLLFLLYSSLESAESLKPKCLREGCNVNMSNLLWQTRILWNVGCVMLKCKCANLCTTWELLAYYGSGNPICRQVTRTWWWIWAVFETTWLQIHVQQANLFWWQDSKKFIGELMHVIAAGGFQERQGHISIFQFWGHCQSLDSLWHPFASPLVCYGVFFVKPLLLGLARIYWYASSPPYPFHMMGLISVLYMLFLVFHMPSWKEPVLNGPILTL